MSNFRGRISNGRRVAASSNRKMSKFAKRFNRILASQQFELVDISKSSGTFGGNLVIFKYNKDASSDQAVAALAKYLTTTGVSDLAEILSNDQFGTIADSFNTVVGEENEYINLKNADSSIFNKPNELAKAIKAPFVELMFDQNTEYNEEEGQWETFWS